MSDTSNLASNNIEPSMEDILSSIRKVIAEDLSQKEDTKTQAETEVKAEAEPHTEISPIDNSEITATEQTAPVDLQPTHEPSIAEVPQDDILELDNLLGDIDDPDSDTDELMELIQFEDDTTDIQAADAEFETLTVPSPVLPNPENISDPDNISEQEPSLESPTEQIAEQDDEQAARFDFDETLDLVMDADASDYITKNIAPSHAEPKEEQVEAFEKSNPDEELTASILDDILPDEQNDADFETLEIAQEPEPKPEQEPAHVREPIQASSNDDMDLVKSLLDDLMDEPISDTVSEAVSESISESGETTISETSFSVEDVFSEEDLLIPDPEAVQEQTPSIEELNQSPEPPASEINIIGEADINSSSDEPEDTGPESEVENELAQLAREIAEVRDITTEDAVTNDDRGTNDDVVELSTPDYTSKLALSASLTGGAALVGGNTDGLIATEAENDLENLQQLIAEKDRAETTSKTTEPTEEQEMIKSPIQEEKAMATPLKNDVLSDADTQQEVGNAFATLTTTVQEHALAEENGPPIGELVKEALRPMLQEWLDKNLKGMVQRAVTKEIKRISTGK